MATSRWLICINSLEYYITEAVKAEVLEWFPA